VRPAFEPHWLPLDPAIGTSEADSRPSRARAKFHRNSTGQRLLRAHSEPNRLLCNAMAANRADQLSVCIRDAVANDLRLSAFTNAWDTTCSGHWAQVQRSRSGSGSNLPRFGRRGARHRQIGQGLDSLGLAYIVDTSDTLDSLRHRCQPARR